MDSMTDLFSPLFDSFSFNAQSRSKGVTESGLYGRVSSSPLSPEALSTIHKIEGEHKIDGFRVATALISLLVHQLTSKRHFTVGALQCIDQHQLNKDRNWVPLAGPLTSGGPSKHSIVAFPISVDPTVTFLELLQSKPSSVQSPNLEHLSESHRIGLIFGYGDAYSSLLCPSHFEVLVYLTVDFEVQVHYNVTFIGDLFARRLLDHLELLMGGLFFRQEAATQISLCNKLLPNEKLILNALSRPLHDLPCDPSDCVPDLFFQKAKEQPDSVCLYSEQKCYSYKEMMERAILLARLLQSHGVQADQVVGACFENSRLFVEGILGILCSGGAYCSLDPELPTNRQMYILNDAKLSVVVTEEKLKTKLEALNMKLKIITVDSSLLEEEGKKAKEWKRLYSRSSLAYTLYTSGSTGKPKGVLIEHSVLLNQCFSLREMYKPYSPMEKDITIQLSKFTFDSHVTEIFPRLIFGGSIVVLKPRGQIDFSYIEETMNTYKVSSIDMVPSLASEFINHLNSPPYKTMPLVSPTSDSSQEEENPGANS